MISLLSLVSKLLERCIKIIDHISSNLSHLQFGFLKGRSTTTQLLSVYHKIQESVDAGLQTNMVFLDFSKAFDSVNHHKLLFKLKGEVSHFRHILFLYFLAILRISCRFSLIKAHKLHYFHLLLYSRDNRCAAKSLQFQRLHPASIFAFSML